MDAYSKYEKDDDGSVIDPPVIAEHERKLAAANASADEFAIEDAAADYEKARADLVKRHNARADKLAKEKQQEASA